MLRKCNYLGHAKKGESLINTILTCGKITHFKYFNSSIIIIDSQAIYIDTPKNRKVLQRSTVLFTLI